jgi:hypothetical protein
MYAEISIFRSFEEKNIIALTSSIHFKGILYLRNQYFFNSLERSDMCLNWF